LHCRNGNEYHDIDARTSDALALAVRFNCPIFTYEPILDTGGIVFDAEQEEKKSETLVNDPKRAGGFDDKSDAELKKLMDEALLNENYEKAAKLRDELERRNSL
jgi:bifunctional DNase/RNase